MIRLFSVVPMIALFASSGSTLTSKLAAVIIFIFITLLVFGERR